MFSRLNLLIAPVYALMACLLALWLPHWSGEITVSMSLLIGALAFLACALAHVAVIGLRSERRLNSAMTAIRQRQETVDHEIAQARAEARQIYEALREAGRTGGGLADVVAELGVLRRLVDQLRGPRPAEHASEPKLPVNRSRLLSAPAIRVPAPAAPTAQPAAAGGVLEEVRAGLRAGRIDLLLQPIVSLPQRHKRFFECFSRIRAEDGTVLLPEEYIPLAARSGLVSTIDNMLLFRCIQLIRRSRQRDASVGFFCNISRHSLSDRDFFRDFVDFIRQNDDLAPNLIFEIAQRDFDLADVELEACIRTFADLGIRFSIDNVTDYGVDAAALAERNVRFFKVNATEFQTDGGDASWELPVFRLRRSLSQHGIELIVEKLEREQQVVELLEYDVNLGQGYLFGQPKQEAAPAA